MASRDRSWSEQIRDLIEQVDRARSESERVRGDAERAMKRDQFWPDRRREPRFQNDESHARYRHRP
jgi:hypothetical protein